MTVVSFASVRGAPGVTTIAHLVAAATPGSALVEADLSGGVMAVRYGLGREPGLTTLAAADPATADGWRAHAQDAGGVPVLVGPDTAEASESLWSTAGDRLVKLIELSDITTAMTDLGRLGSAPPLVGSSQVVVIVTRPTAEHLVALANRLPRLRSAATRGEVCAVLCGAGAYTLSDVESQLDLRVLAELPDDRRTADALVHGGRGISPRSPLVRAAEGLAASLDSFRLRARPPVRAGR
jgi:MinD-like ATPase involved in chromosome partitioning or flagellar assembly